MMLINHHQRQPPPTSSIATTIFLLGGLRAVAYYTYAFVNALHVIKVPGLTVESRFRLLGQTLRALSVGLEGGAALRLARFRHLRVLALGFFGFRLRS